MADKLDIQQRITRAKVRLLMTQTFFGTLLSRLKMIEVQKGEMPCDTMATDGTNLYWYRPYVESLDDLNLQGLFAHEVMHVALQHPLRRGARDPERWNIACDGAVDHMLKDAGLTVPSSFADDPKCAWMRGLSADEIYHRLPTENPEMMPKPQPGEGQPGAGKPGQGAPRPGGVLDSPNVGNPAKATQEGQDIKIAVHQAAMAGKSKGTQPAWLKHFINDLMAPVVVWQDHLRIFISDHIPNGQTWSKPNRRHAHTGLHLPGVLRDGIGEGAIFFDTSGSTSDWWKQFLSECNSVIEDCQPERVHVIQCDAGVGDIHTYERGDTIDNAVIGGGGSDFRPAFAAVEELRLPLKWAIVLSDMHIDFPTDPPGYPVMMFSTTDRKGPDWATTIRMLK